MAHAKEPKLPRTLEEKESTPRLIVVLESACLETVKFGKSFQLLNSDDHYSLLKKKNRDIEDARPDITHQCLLMLLDSPLNKAGLLQIYIRTAKNVLIEINPKCRIPRTFKRFSGLMVQLLHEMSIKAKDGNEKLLKLIKNPVTDYFPIESIKVGMSHKATELVDIVDWVEEQPKDKPFVFVIGAFAHGKIEADYLEKEISISQYPLSAAGVCGKLCTAFERHWNIL